MRETCGMESKYALQHDQKSVRALRDSINIMESIGDTTKALSVIFIADDKLNDIAIVMIRITYNFKGSTLSKFDIILYF